MLPSHALHTLLTFHKNYYEPGYWVNRVNLTTQLTGIAFLRCYYRKNTSYTHLRRHTRITECSSVYARLWQKGFRCIRSKYCSQCSGPYFYVPVILYFKAATTCYQRKLCFKYRILLGLIINNQCCQHYR